MQCMAGLWWDQQRRSCVLPSEVACNPYNIINSQGQGGYIDNNPNGKVPHFLSLSVTNLHMFLSLSSDPSNCTCAASSSLHAY